MSKWGASHVLDKLGGHAVVILRFWPASYSTVDLCSRFEQSAVIGRGCRERVQPEELLGGTELSSIIRHVAFKALTWNKT